MDFTFKMIASMFLPAFMESSSGVFLNMLNTIMVSHVGEYAISATSIVGNVYLMAVNFFIGISTGIIVKVSQYFGAKKFEECERTARQGIAMCVGLSLIFMVIILVFGRRILYTIFASAEKDVLEAARIYLMCLAISMPFNSLYSASNAVVYGTGDFRRTFMNSIRANLINVVTSAILIYVFKLGVLGVGIGAIVCPLISSFLVYRRLRKGTNFIKIGSAFVVPERRTISELLGISIPTGLDNIVIYISNIVLSAIVVKMGSTATAAYGITNSISTLLVIVAVATNTVSVTLIGQLYGAREYAKCRRYALIMIATGAALAAAGCIVVGIMDDFVIGLYNPMPVTFDAIKDALKIMLVIHTFMWAPGFVTPAALRGCGDVRYSTVVSMSAMVIKVPFAWLFGVHMGMGISGLWCSVAVEWGLRIVFILPRLFSSKWIKKGEVRSAE